MVKISTIDTMNITTYNKYPSLMEANPLKDVDTMDITATAEFISLYMIEKWTVLMLMEEP